MVEVLLVTTVALLVVFVCLLGFRRGTDERSHELIDVQLEARKAERKLNELTRQAFIAMAEHAMLSRERGGRQRSSRNGS